MPDRFGYRLAVVFLGVVVVLGLVGLIWITYERITIPESLVAIPSVAVGALAGLVAPWRPAGQPAAGPEPASTPQAFTPPQI